MTVLLSWMANYHLSGSVQANREMTADILALKAIILELQTPKFIPWINTIGLVLNSLDDNYLLICGSLGLGAILFKTRDLVHSCTL